MSESHDPPGRDEASPPSAESADLPDDRTGTVEQVPQPPPGGRETILLVEDDDSLRVVVGAVLRRLGYQVLEAATPGEAFMLFAAHGPEIGLLLSDIVLPEMDGPTLADRLVAVRPDLRVLFVSGYEDDELPIEDDNPNVGFLSKPFQTAVLADTIRALLSTAGDGGR